MQRGPGRPSIYICTQKEPDRSVFRSRAAHLECVYGFRRSFVRSFVRSSIDLVAGVLESVCTCMYTAFFVAAEYVLVRASTCHAHVFGVRSNADGMEDLDLVIYSWRIHICMYVCGTCTRRTPPGCDYGHGESLVAVTRADNIYSALYIQSRH